MFLAALLLHTSDADAEGAPPSIPPEAAKLIEEWLREQDAPGVSVAAVNRDGVLWAGGFGLADIEAKRPATASTRYQFASVTKVYTALLLAQLAEEGIVDLHAPLSTYLPDFQPLSPQPSGRPVTLFDLATHSAGFTRDMRGPKASGKPHSYTWDEVLAWEGESGMTTLPGVHQRYSNYGYAVLGQALERAAGKDYRTLIRERVFEPLGLDESGFAELREHPERAAGYYKKDDEIVRGSDFVWDFGVQASASELIATAVDVARFARAHLGGKGSLPQPVLQRLLTPAFPMGGSGAMGLGWHYSWGGGIPRWSHGGAVNTYRSVVSIRPDVGIGLAMAANGNADWGKLERPLLSLLASNADTTEQDALTGDYEPPGGGTKVMIRRNADAVLTLEVRGAIRMVPWGQDTYRVIEGLNKDEWVRFIHEGDEQVMLWEHRRFVRTAMAGG